MDNLEILVFRKENNLTQQDLAKLLGVSKRTIINYEKGENIPNPKKEMFLTIKSQFTNKNNQIKEPEESYLADTTKIIDPEIFLKTLNPTFILSYIMENYDSFKDNQAFKILVNHYYCEANKNKKA